MKVCLDTNVLVSGIYWDGVPGVLLDLWAKGHFELLLSPAILEEYKRVFHEMEQRYETGDADKWIAAIVAKSMMVMAQPQSTGQSRDKDDDKFIDCCQAREGQIIW